MRNNIIIQDVLKKAGWYEGRMASKAVVTQVIMKEGYSMFPNVIEFLQEFWDLTIYFENKRNGLKNDDITFVFEKATHLEVPERIKGDYSFRIGKELCLIGSVYREHMVLMMSSDKCVYGGYDDFLCKISDSGYGAIEAIIFDYDFIEIR